MFDHVEHLRDAVMHLAQQPALGGHAGVAESQLAGRGDLDTHLLFEVGGKDSVALAGQLAGLKIKVEFWYEEQRQALGARSADTFDAVRPSQYQVNDVLGQVMLSRGNEALDALDVPCAIGLWNRPGPPSPDIGTRVWLCQHHRGTPLTLNHDLSDAAI